MKTCKKILSIFLCLAVLIGTIALGLSVIALHPDSDLYTRDVIDQRDDYEIDDIFAYPAVELKNYVGDVVFPRTYSDFEPADMDTLRIDLCPILTLDSDAENDRKVFDCYYFAYDERLFGNLSREDVEGSYADMFEVTQCDAAAQQAYDDAVASGDPTELSLQIDTLKYNRTFTSQQAQEFMTALGVASLENYQILYIDSPTAAVGKKDLTYVSYPGDFLEEREYVWTEDGEDPYLNTQTLITFKIKGDAPYGIEGKIGVVGADWMTTRSRFNASGVRTRAAVYVDPKTTLSEHSLVTFVTTPKYNFDPNGGEFAPGIDVEADGTHSRVVEVGDEIDLSTLAPTRSDGVEFMGWKVGNEFYEPTATYTVTAENAILQTFTAFWADGTVPIYMSKIPGFNAAGKLNYVDGTSYWEQVGTLYGNNGEALTQANINEVIYLVSNTATTENPYDIDPEIAQQLGYTDSGLNITLTTFAATANIPYPMVRPFEQDNFSGPTGRFPISGFKFGDNLTALYVVSEIKFEADAYFPNRNPDGTLQNDGTLIEHYTVTPGFKSVTYRTGASGRITSQLTVFSLADFQDPDLDEETEVQKYKVASLSNPSTTVNPEISKNILAPDITARNVIRIFSVVSNKRFYVGLNAKVNQDNYKLFNSFFRLGDSVTYDDLSEIGRYAAEGDGNVFTRDATLDEVMVGGAKVGNPGYYLTDLFFLNPLTQERTDFVVNGVPDENASFVYTSELNTYAANHDPWKGAASTQSGRTISTALFLNSTWAIQSYYFRVTYTNADGEKTFLTNITLQGDVDVVVKANLSQELQDIVAQDHPEGFICTNYNFTVDGQPKPAQCKAYNYSTDPDNPTILDLIYTEDRRYAYVDYNNGKSAEEDTSHRRYDTLNYGDLVYRPNWEPEEEGDEKPPFNRYMDNFAPASNALREVDKDDDGNIIYEQLQRPVIGPDGQPVTDANGVVLMENVYEDKLDENGEPMLDAEGKPIPDYEKPVYDESKPVYVDPKGNTVERPYRNCEFMGYKVYQVANDGNNYESFADLPARETWTEISLSDEILAFDTPILQIQWKSDKDFFFRVYNGTTTVVNPIAPFMGGKMISELGTSTIYSALGKDFKMYYWKDNKPCSKAEAVFNPNPEDYFTLFLKIQMEEAVFEDGSTKKMPVISAVQISKALFTDPMFIGKLIPTVLNLLQSLLSGKLSL